MRSGTSIEKRIAEEQALSNKRSKHTQYNRQGHAIGSNTLKGKRAYK